MLWPQVVAAGASFECLFFDWTERAVPLTPQYAVKKKQNVHLITV